MARIRLFNSKETKSVPVNGPANGKERVVPAVKASKHFPAESAPTPKKTRKVSKPGKLRSSITPGTVLIMLAGQYRGKRVVFLKQLPSGLLLVTGPHKINGVPLRRVNQAYVMATSTKIDVASVKIGENITDAFFKKVEQKKSSKPTEEGLFGDKNNAKKEKKPADPAKVAAQKEIDAQILAEVKKVPQLSSYLGSTFTLTSGQYPHLMKF